MSRIRSFALVLAIVTWARGPLGADPPPAVRGAVLAGRVLDPQGAGVSDVVVELYDAPYGGFVNGRDWRPIVPTQAWWEPVPDVSPRAVTRTGPGGRWAFEGLDPALRFRARARSSGGLSSDDAVRYASTPFDAEDLVLRADAPVTVLSTDGAGKPLACDVVVRGGTVQSTEVSGPTAVYRAAADGRTRLLGLSAGVVEVDVRLAGRAVIRTQVTVPAPREVVVRVGDASGATAEGRVTDTSGAPVAGARIVVATRTGGAATAGVDSLLLATSDANGSWRVAGIPPGLFLGLSVTAAGFVPATGIDARRRVTAKDVLTYETALGRAGRAAGRVVGPDAKPIPGARVSIDEVSVETDASGRWQLDGVAAGARELRVRAAGWYLPHSPAETGWNPGGGVWLDVRADAVVEAPDLVLHRGVRVEGRVLDEGGTPVPGAWVLASSRTAGLGWLEGGRRAVISTSAAGGTYVLEDLLPDGEWEFSVRAVGMATDPLPNAFLRDAGSAIRADFVVRRLARISGRTVDPNGTPAPGVEVELIGPERRKVRSGPEGRFEAPEIRAGSYRIEPTYVGRPHRERPSVVVNVGPGGLADAVVFPLDPPRAIAGVVVDEKGAPAAGVYVELKADEPWQFVDRWRGEESWWQWGTVTDVAGRFRIENLWPGGYWTRPSAGNGPVEAGTEDVRLVWYRDTETEIAGPEDSMRGMNRWDIDGDAVPIEGLVLGPDGAPVPSASVSITVRSGSGSQGHGADVVAGRFRSTVRSGGDTVDVVAVRARDASGAPLDFGPGQVTGLKPGVGRVEIRMTKGRTISGRVVDAEGRPVPGAVVFASPASDERTFTGTSGSTATDARGTFRFVGFAPGDFELTSAPAPSAAPATAVVPAGATDVELRYPAMQWIQGRVLDDASQPIVGFGLSTDGARTKTSLDGSFRIGPVEGTVVLKGPARWTWGPREVDLPEYGPVESPPVLAGTSGVELRTSRVYAVSGRVVAGDGVEARPDVELRLEPEPADPTRPPVVGRQSFSESGFRLMAPPGRWRLIATSRSWNGRDHKVHTTSAVVTCPASGLELVLEDPIGVRGTLVGEGAAGFLVSFVAAGPHGPSSAGVATAPDGAFRWPTHEAGPFLVFASRIGDDRFALLDAVPSGGPSLKLPLRLGRRIEGTLHGFGTPFDRTKATIWAQSRRGLVVHGVIEADGRFSIRGLPPSEAWILEARAIDGTGVREGRVSDVSSGTADVVVSTGS